MQNRINLLAPPADTKRQDKKGPSMVLVIAGVIILALSAAAYGSMFFLSYRTAAKIEENKVKIEKLTQVSAAADELSRLKKEKSEVEGAIQKIDAAKPVLTRCMDEAARLLPPLVTLRSMNMTVNPRSIDIKGTAPSYDVVAQFQANLLDSEILNDVYIKASVRDEKAGYVVFNLVITPAEGGIKQ
ncbi:PilN domain-containing protein [Phosphitispora fastidiosa]|uniref:PilN domain-containing protein n=1 Tax=Phosphitispora fastidiosa TaxID=2837202 RepID=UPI001E3C3F5D|nr:PilN domain-containing protein [Phosphitispora fastidiosa]MBU7008766.1 Tfp pilus assembly protein PilN [Phosphitispora fastidiosa]